MIRVINNQGLVVYQKIPKIILKAHIISLNETTLEALPIYIQYSSTNSELLQIQERLEEIKNNDIKQEINRIINEYIIRMNKLEYAFDNNKIDEYLRNLSIEEFKKHISDLKEENIELTEKGTEVAKIMNKIIESISCPIETIKLKEKKK